MAKLCNPKTFSHGKYTALGHLVGARPNHSSRRFYHYGQPSAAQKRTHRPATARPGKSDRGVVARRNPTNRFRDQKIYPRMNLEFTPQTRRIGAIIASLLLLTLLVTWFIQQIRTAAAYARAMNDIAEAARKGENVTVQVANFNSNPQPLTDGKSKSESTSKS